MILPILGAIGAAGKSLDKVQSTIVEQLRARGVQLEVFASLAFDPNAPIFFRGSVALSGNVPAQPPKTLGTIMEIAQPSHIADLHAVVLTDAMGKRFIVDATAAQSLELRAGDEIDFPAGTEAYEVMVLGGVLKPGSVPLRNGLTIQEAIQLAGGLSGHGDLQQITLEHSGITNPATTSAVLQKGDIVRVGLTLDRKFVAVKGAVQRQGVVEWRKGMLLSEIIKEAGGEIPGSDLEHIQCRRFTGGKIVKFDLLRIRKGLDKDPVIEANDTLIIPMGARN